MTAVSTKFLAMAEAAGVAATTRPLTSDEGQLHVKQARSKHFESKPKKF